MNVKAAAYQEYNQAAVIDRLFSSMPEIVKALAAPLANVDRITVVSTGGDAAGLKQDHGRFDQDGGAGPRAVRDALGHALERAVLEDTDDRRQVAQAGQPGEGRRAVSKQAGKRGESHGTLRESLNVDPGQYQRPCR